jgi:hypothetical protein
MVSRERALNLDGTPISATRSSYPSFVEACRESMQGQTARDPNFLKGADKVRGAPICFFGSNGTSFEKIVAGSCTSPESAQTDTPSLRSG